MKKIFLPFGILCLFLSSSACGNIQKTNSMQKHTAIYLTKDNGSQATSQAMLDYRKSNLKKLIKEAKKKDINTLKEETALRTAEFFITYAHWDENNVPKNENSFSKVTRYKKEPGKWAALLPEFERSEISKMLIDAQKNLKQVIDGKVKRLPITKVDWTKAKVKGDEILYQGKPVFLNDWTWKPRTKEYTEYHGNLDGFLINPSYVLNEQGDISPNKLKELKNKASGSLGFIFINNTSLPKWAIEKYPKIEDGPGIKYTMYDINNPESHKIMSNLIAGTVPYMAGKKYSALGYMLCNEPHWNCIKGTWASCPISDLAYEDFKVWLKKKHKNIETLNSVWNTNYSSFEAINGPKIMTKEMNGSPMFTDFMLFNQYRVTNWYSFMKSEIKKYDPAAKVHIKLIPHFWTRDGRDSGIDLEALTSLSDIIGNDASTCGSWMWGPAKSWEKNYSFDFIESTMGYDFMKSVSPNKLIFNTENHFLSTGKYRDLYQSKEYTRCNYWLGTIHGLTASQTWYWARREDGSARKGDDNGYMGSNNHQPRVVNEVHQTMIDLTSVGDKIIKFQRERKPIRLFYSKASAINKQTYMSSMFKSYEAGFFNGLPIGFATKDIIEKQDNSLWDAIVVTCTPNVFSSDMEALQSYLDNGGTLIIDDMSLKFDEYNKPLGNSMILRAGKGSIMHVKFQKQAIKKAFDYMAKLGNVPAVNVSEKTNLQKTCSWRVVDGENNSQIVDIINIGKTTRSVSITLKDGSKPTSITDVLTGKEYKSNTFEMPIYDVRLLKIK